ncbi:unnamed protein product [Miscanthus lutarioriparius]|uniref:Uncharacterized protein n=1 Tax=Miscanthus lutarioriparius TaxID=422564 RepID=A0A811NLK0_9POAL|nr:unnamed protein product [Miscanthus lutarioriparius]
MSQTAAAAVANELNGGGGSLHRLHTEGARPPYAATATVLYARPWQRQRTRTATTGVPEAIAIDSSYMNYKEDTWRHWEGWEGYKYGSHINGDQPQPPTTSVATCTQPKPSLRCMDACMESEQTLCKIFFPLHEIAVEAEHTGRRDSGVRAPDEAGLVGNRSEQTGRAHLLEDVGGGDQHGALSFCRCLVARTGRAALLIAGNCACGPHLRGRGRLPWDHARASRARLDSAGRAASLVAGACAATAAAALVRGWLRPCRGPCITAEEAVAEEARSWRRGKRRP